MQKAESKKKTTKKVTPAPYFFAVGRRKTAHVRVKLFPDGAGEFIVNSRKLDAYFPTYYLQKLALNPLQVLGVEKKFNAAVSAEGGGTIAQAQATGLGLSRALIQADPNTRSVLKKQGFLTRDARKKERKKPGLKRARRAPQWQKR